MAKKYTDFHYIIFGGARFCTINGLGVYLVYQNFTRHLLQRGIKNRLGEGLFRKPMEDIFSCFKINCYVESTITCAKKLNNHIISLRYYFLLP